MASFGDVLMPILGMLAGAASPAAGRAIGAMGDMRGDQAQREWERQQQQAAQQRQQAFGQTLSGMIGGEDPQAQMLRTLVAQDPQRYASMAYQHARPQPQEFTPEQAAGLQGQLGPGMSASLPMQGGGSMSVRPRPAEPIPPMLERPAPDPERDRWAQKYPSYLEQMRSMGAPDPLVQAYAERWEADPTKANDEWISWQEKYYRERAKAQKDAEKVRSETAADATKARSEAQKEQQKAYQDFHKIYREMAEFNAKHPGDGSGPPYPRPMLASENTANLKWRQLQSDYQRAKARVLKYGKLANAGPDTSTGGQPTGQQGTSSPGRVRLTLDDFQ